MATSMNTSRVVGRTSLAIKSHNATVKLQAAKATPLRGSAYTRSARLVCNAEEKVGGNKFLAKLGRVIKEKAKADIDRVFKGTSKTREGLAVVDELLTYWKLDESDNLLENLEEALIAADFGPGSSMKIVDSIRERVESGELKTGDDMKNALKDSLKTLLKARGGNSALNLVDETPNVIMIVGVNGGGKTTTIGKLSKKFTDEGAKVVVAAGDTFRAAAGEQLQEWADRAGAEMAPYEKNMKPSAVLYKAVEYASSNEVKADILIADTSGRLHTNINLMNELVKSKEAITKKMPTAPHEVLLVLDGTTGLNMLNQAREFNRQLTLSGLILTKLDGTSRGGCVVSVVDELGLPIKFVGVGEAMEDLQPFNADVFIDSLFP